MGLREPSPLTLVSELFLLDISLSKVSLCSGCVTPFLGTVEWKVSSFMYIHILGHLSEEEYSQNSLIHCLIVYSHLASELVIDLGLSECWVVFSCNKSAFWVATNVCYGASVTMICSVCKLTCKQTIPLHSNASPTRRLSTLLLQTW